MKAEFDNAYIKVWFSTQSTSRNFYNVTEIIMQENVVLIKTKEGHQNLLNLNNVTLIEEIEKR